MTALHLACLNGNTETAEALLDAGIPIGELDTVYDQVSPSLCLTGFASMVALRIIWHVLGSMKRLSQCC